MTRAKIFIDGEAGTTGLKIRAELGIRDDIELLSIAADKRKDQDERRRLINAADVVILCLPDDAARESVALIANPDTRVIDASTAHRTAAGWTYGFAEMARDQAAAIAAARTQVTSAQSQVQAIDATLERIQAEIDDSQLKAPRDGRVQFRLAQPGEVLGAGGKVLNLVDLSDVYMSFFLPETAAGRVALGTEVRIVLDAAPQFVIPAEVSFVSSTAQFTPKTVETASERQKLMFRVKARIAPELLQKHLEQVKTGLPGEAWIKLDPHSAWPAHLQTKLAP